MLSNEDLVIILVKKYNDFDGVLRMTSEGYGCETSLLRYSNLKLANECLSRKVIMLKESVADRDYTVELKRNRSNVKFKSIGSSQANNSL